MLTVYDFDEDDEGCVRLHVNTDEPYSVEAGQRIAAKVEATDDLLAAMVDFVKRYEDDPDDLGNMDALAKDARAIIAKATGQ